MSITAFVLGILSLLAWLLPIVGLPVSAVALGLGVAGRSSSARRMAIAAIVLASIGLALTVINGGLGMYEALRRAAGG